VSPLSSPEDGRRTSFRNVVILYYILIFYPEDGQSPEAKRYRDLAGKPEGKRPLEKPKRRWEDNN
jgi:hypothetical protein